MKNFLLLIFLVSHSLILNAQNVFDIGIRNIEIYFSEPNWDDTLDVYYANNLGQRLIADSVVIDGEIDHDVGVKYKGNSSYNINNTKNPLNIKLDYINNGQSIDGYNVLKLSNGFKDPTFVREVLSYEIARQYMPAPKATYANVSVNGSLIGVYVCVQSIDNDFTNEHFYERKGPFFKAEMTNLMIPNCPGPLGIWDYFTDTMCYQRAYEMQSSADWTKLSNFLDTLHNNFSYIENVLDIDRALWMMAFENLTVCLDGPINAIPHNFYLFKDNNGRFSPIMWDMNQAFGTFTNGLPSPVTNQDLQELDIFHTGGTDNYMNNQIFSSDRYKKMYAAHMRTILEENFSNSNYANRISDLQQLISSYIGLDPNTFFSFADFQNNVNSTVANNIGITELMSSRINFLQNLSEISANPPVITNLNYGPIPVSPSSSINITASISDVNYVYLGYRYKFADKFEKIQMLDDGNNGDGVAGDGIYGATINVDARDVQYYIYAENNNAGIFSPERAEKEFHQIPVVGGLVINEIMASNISSIADQDGEFDDWVELYNGNNFSLNLNGYYLSDNENDLYKWSFPNISIPANDYLIVWCDTAGNSQSGLHTTYRLSADQEEVYLTSPTGVVLDAVHFVNMPTDLSYSRVPNGSGPFVYQNQSYNQNNESISSSDLNYNKQSKIRIYPNPSNDKIYILGANKPINIFDMLGKQIIYNENVQILDISSWDNGVYFLISDKETFKIIKQ